ncbi:MAG: VCBS repeat-containing protein [Verrucomicrobia bacterium]|nr:VCBS repeat-containing protein [Verrucomicrobiota bacterium]
MNVRKFIRWLVVLVCGFQFTSTQAASSLNWQTADGYRFADVKPEGAGRVGFTRISSAHSGINFTNHLSDLASLENRILENGSGIAAGDFDGDSLCDLYFCQLEGPNVLYRNLGDWKFEDVTQRAGVACSVQHSTGTAFADLDGDGKLDLLVASLGGGVRCFMNVGGGKFEERLDSGLVRTGGTMSLTLADVDGDGDLDLYVANYRTQTVKDSAFDFSRFKIINGRWEVPADLADRFISAIDAAGHPILHEQGEADVLYLNDGKGHFSAVIWTDGHFLDVDGQPLKSAPRDWSLSAMFRDVNGDGLPDLYVCSDFVQPDRFWINQGNGRFRAPARSALTRTSRLSMGVDFGDLNRDGFDDFFVVDMLSPDRVFRMRQRENLKPAMWSDYTERQRPQVMRNTLFMNLGNGTFAEIAQLAGVQASDWSWSAIFLDVDLDGFEDILISNGSNHDYQDVDVQREIERRAPDSFPVRHRNAGRLLFPPLHTPNYLYRNLGNFSFEEVGTKWGFASTNIGHGMVLADLDNDGDLDVVINTLNAGCEIYRNDAPGPRLAVRLRGEAGNTRGVGARVRVKQRDFTQEQEIIAGGRYLSGDDAMRTFAADDTKGKLEIEVRWPGGKVSHVSDARPNRIYEVSEAGAKETVSPARVAETNTLFADASALLKHRHSASSFDDGELQPGEDLIAKVDDAMSADVASIELLCGISNYENPHAITNAVLRFQFTNSELIARERIPGWGDSVGPLCLADVDHDGQLDLFVGGRIRPGRYPEPASSKLFLGRDGKFLEDTNASRLFASVGLVSGAVFSDLDGDGWPDLILACEWGPVRVFSNQRGQFVEATDRLGLAKLTGLWNCVATADLNHDGRPDIIAGNWGRNTKYQAYLAPSIGIVFGELDPATPFFQVETYFDPKLQIEAPWWDRDSLATLLPWLPEKFPTHTEYARAGIANILGEHFTKMKRLEAATLDSMIFLNRGDHFDPVALPLAAQLAPCFGIAVADFDGDGNGDIFLNQNFSGTELETSPYNDGVGVVLLGDGQGGFHALPPGQSGVALAGDGRGCAVADWNRDGRPDLIATQSNQAMRLLMNRAGRPAARVRSQSATGARAKGDSLSPKW